MTERIYVGLHADAGGRAALKEAFPEGELIQHAGFWYFWHEDFEAKSGRALQDAAAHDFYSPARETAQLLDNREILLGAYAHNLHVETDGSREVVPWPPIEARMTVVLQPTTLSAVVLTDPAAVAAANAPPPPPPPPASRPVERQRRMKKSQPKFAAAAHLLTSNDTGQLQLRQAKEHIVDGLVAKGMQFKGEVIRSTFAALAGVSEDEIDRMQDTMDRHWIHVGKPQRFAEAMPFLRVREILRLIMKGWLDRDEPT